MIPRLSWNLVSWVWSLLPLPWITSFIHLLEYCHGAHGILRCCSLLNLQNKFLDVVIFVCVHPFSGLKMYFPMLSRLPGFLLRSLMLLSCFYIWIMIFLLDIFLTMIFVSNLCVDSNVLCWGSSLVMLIGFLNLMFGDPFLSKCLRTFSAIVTLN